MCRLTYNTPFSSRSTSFVHERFTNLSITVPFVTAWEDLSLPFLYLSVYTIPHPGLSLYNRCVAGVWSIQGTDDFCLLDRLYD